MRALPAVDFAKLTMVARFMLENAKFKAVTYIAEFWEVTSALFFPFKLFVFIDWL